MRIGLGYDVHRTEPGGRLVIGGVEIEAPFGLLGHSDADVLAHAVADAMLGACALGDIGGHFPDTDERFAGADSIELLRRVAALCREAGFSAGNVDAAVICEEPMITPHAPVMRERLAGAMGIDVGRVSVKGRRPEGLGPLGAGEGIAAMAVVLMEGPD